MKIPRVMIAAAASGSGKTAISCGLLQALKDRQQNVVSVKCGPDYIDPMFHREVLGLEAENLDLFFGDKQMLMEVFAAHVSNADFCLAEGVMGYYDGMTMDSDKASSYDVARTLQMPVILVVPCKGMALSVLAVIKGLIEFREDSSIRGILLNRVSPALYPRMKQMIEKGLNESGYFVPVIGYVPESEVFRLESRHLGLVQPGEIYEFRKQFQAAGAVLAETVDFPQLLRIAAAAPELEVPVMQFETVPPQVKLGIAKDAAFGFYYKDNLEWLRRMGCELVEFSPLNDPQLPEGISGILLGGGYPELYAERLSQNIDLKRAMKAALADGMPCLAECGGFLYLQEQLDDADGNCYEMVGVIAGRSRRREQLVRFGYITITGMVNSVYLHSGEKLRGHEFHYWDSEDNGNACLAEKPNGSKSWACVHANGNLFAGYPHLYYGSNLKFVWRFVNQLKIYADRKGNSYDGRSDSWKNTSVPGEQYGTGEKTLDVSRETVVQPRNSGRSHYPDCRNEADG